MTNQEIDQKLKELCRIIALCSASVPMPEWPPYVIEADSYLQRFYFRHLYNLITKARNLNIPWKEIGYVLYPSRVAQIMHSIYGLSSSGLRDYEKRDLVDSLISIISSRRVDPFCKNQSNILYSQSEIDKLFSRVRVENKTQDANWLRKSQLLSRINALLFSLCDVLHVCQHAASHEFHGPYIIKESQVIIREYYDLKPIEVWPILKNLPFNRITTLEIYQGVNINFSFFNHIIPTSSLPDNLTGMVVVKNNDFLDYYTVEELDELLADLSLTMKDITNEVIPFSKTDWICKYVEMHYYVLQPLANLVGEDWHPSKEQMDIINTQADMKAAFAFHVLNGLSFDERIITLENLYNSFLFNK